MTSIEPEWVQEQVVLAYHAEQLTEHGSSDGVRDMGLLQSALARPLNAFHYNQVTSLAELAAAYGYGIAKNHPFVDGNKRTALVVTVAFLAMNGFDVDTSQEEIFDTFYALAAGQLSEAQLAAWLKSKIRQL